MRLKEIKPGMVIHCKNDEEKKALLEEAERLGYRWRGEENLPTDKTVDSGMTIHFNNKDVWKDYKYITWSNYTYGVTEFSDLILPELTAEEALNICGEICKEYSNKGCECSSKCPFAYHDGMSCTFYRSQNPDKTIEILGQWKSDHEKKEPEIETVDICRIIEIQPDGRKRCVHEEDIKPDSDLPYGYERDSVNAILKRYCIEHDGEFIAVHEVVSRVKR